ncbi:hypothetical protein ABH892_004430 [Paenibacillus sp. RC254]|uniref:hypothetical protein n=1 Tax=unclassified Paenibacillus TaxID=185978 RepID=UPI0024BB55C1|nr:MULTISPECIES: hypothetical protein [unclassified Paenibacillus]
MKKAELLAEQARLFSIANELARKHWGVDYTGTLVLVNRPWRNRWACFRSTTEDDSLREVRMSAVVNASRSEEAVIGSLLHELVHWRLCTSGLPYSDTDYGFIAECLRVGAPISRARSAQEAYQRFKQRQAFEERAGCKFDEAV